MANIQISIPDAAMPRVEAAFASEFGYHDTVLDGSPNQETKQQFARRMIRNYIKDVTANAEARAAGNVAADQARSDLG